MNQTPLVSIIVPTWNGEKFIENCLNSLLSQDYPKFEVIVVDNASSDSTPDWVATRFPTVTLIRNERNLGFAGGVNVGLRVAKGQVLILFNQDATAEPGWLEAMVRGLTGSSDIGIAGCKIYYWGKEALWHAGVMLTDPRMQVTHIGDGEIDRGQYDQPTGVDAVTGAAMAIKRTVLDEIGLFDEDYFVYFEDIDFCVRARKAGYRIVYLPEAIVQHHVAGSLGQESPQIFEHYHLSRLLFLLKHFDIEWLNTQLAPAEIAWLQKGLFFSEYRLIRKVYLSTMSGLIQVSTPYQFIQQCFNYEQRKKIIELLEHLAEAVIEAMLTEGREKPWLLQQNEDALNWWQVAEIPFVSTVPLLGPLIARFREMWNNVAARWYVRGLLMQQLKINQRLAFTAEIHQHLIRELNNEIILLHQSLAHLASRQNKNY